MSKHELKKPTSKEEARMHFIIPESFIFLDPSSASQIRKKRISENHDPSSPCIKLCILHGFIVRLAFR